MQSSRHNHITRYAVGLTLAATLLVSGCSSDRWGFPYRVGVQQGNWVTERQVGLLYQGMTREQVRYALGTPTLTNALHANRWDYPYFYMAPNGNTDMRNLSVIFNGDLLVSWSGDEQPTLEPFQIAREEVQKSQEEQAQAKLDAERAQNGTGIEGLQVSPGLGISMDNEIQPSSDPYDSPDDPYASPIRLM